MKYGKTDVVVCKDEKELGAKSAAAVAGVMRELLKNEPEIRMIMAGGESQMTFLAALSCELNLDWSRVVCFNMDDFWDVKMPEHFTCGYQTKTQLYDKVKPRRVELVRYNAPDPDAEARRFAALMKSAGPFHILCQGIGTSGHLALNEPGATDFNDLLLVRTVDVAEQSKKQLIADPNFRELGYIPQKGITMTIPAMLAAKHVFTIVPLGLKRPILTRLFDTKNPTTDLPASILLQHRGTLFVDRNSCPESVLAIMQ